MDISKQLIKTTAAAAVLGLSAAKLAKFRCNGGGPKYVKLGHAVRYRNSDLEEWVESKLAHNLPEKSVPTKANLSS